MHCFEKYKEANSNEPNTSGISVKANKNFTNKKVFSDFSFFARLIFEQLNEERLIKKNVQQVALALTLCKLTGKAESTNFIIDGK
jgi:hypothetical protein